MLKRYFCCKNTKKSRQLRVLTHATNDIKLFNLNKKKFKAKVVDIHDGHNLKVVFYINDDILVKFKLRMLGYNSPNIHSRNGIEKINGVKSRDFLKKCVEYKIVDLHCGEFDKNGKLCGIIYCDNININQLMIDSGNGIAHIKNNRSSYNKLNKLL